VISRVQSSCKRIRYCYSHSCYAFCLLSLCCTNLLSQASLKSFPTKQAQQRKARKEDAARLSEDFIFYGGWKFIEDDERSGVMLHFQLSATFFKTCI